MEFIELCVIITKVEFDNIKYLQYLIQHVRRYKNLIDIKFFFFREIVNFFVLNDHQESFFFRSVCN